MKTIIPVFKRCVLRGSNAILEPIRALSSVELAEPVPMPTQDYVFETEQEEDGRWIAEIPDLPGVMAYGSSQEEAIANAEAIALRVIADRIESSKQAMGRVSFVHA